MIGKSNRKTKYEIDCRKCTRIYVWGRIHWCKPSVDGEKTIYVEDTESGYVVKCGWFTEEPMQAELYPHPEILRMELFEGVEQ